MATYGRTTIYWHESTPNKLDVNEVKSILEYALPIHNTNRDTIMSLHDYYLGNQPILDKEKLIRPEINNIVLENNAFQIVEFKKGYVFGKPIQYVRKGDVESGEIAVLNDYMSMQDKDTKDIDLSEWMYVSGLAYRIALPNKDGEESPFRVENLDARNTFVVYSSRIGNKPLLGCTFEIDENAEIIYYSVYTNTNYYEFSATYMGSLISSEIQLLKEEELKLGMLPIVEYPLNQSRIGLIELVQSILDALNKISSNDLDDIEQFVQSLLVFVNQDIDEETLRKLLELGALKIYSQDPSKPADVRLLTSKLNHADTKVFYDRLFDNMLAIVGVPRMNDKPSGGDTGQARLLGEGWTMADQRASQDELSFKKAEKRLLKIILNICKGLNEEISTLRIKDLDIKFTRNKSDNIIVKSQGLLNMKSAGISPDVAITTCELFSDPNEVYEKSKQYNPEFWSTTKTETEPTKDAQEVSNEISGNNGGINE